jgi:iron complex outermembrane receptor protein
MARSHLFGALLVSAVASALTAQAAAEESAPAAANENAQNNASSSGLEEIVVTARRVAENQQSVPVAITAISSETLREEHLVDVSDLPRVTPALTVTTSTRGSSTPAYMIRGQRAFSVNTLSEPSVTLYFAEVGQSLTTGSNLSLYDLQSVQVLKGPQGTLFGRNTTGGAILFTPAAPGHEFGGYVQATGGNYSLRDYEGALNVPVTDTLAIRFAGKSQRRDGYLSDPARADEAGNQRADSARLSVRWTPGAFETTLMGTYFKDDVQNATKLFALDPTRVPASLGPFRPLVTAQLQAALAQTNAVGQYQFLDGSPEYSRDTVYGIQDISTLDLGSGLLDSFALKNIVGYRNVDTHYHFNTDGSPIGLIDYPGTITANQLSDEFQVIGKVKSLDFIAGLFYYRLNSNDRADSYQLGFLNRLLPPPVNALFPALSLQEYEARNKSYAGFAHFNYDLASLIEGLSLSAGGRVTKDERGVIYHNRTASGPNPTVFKCTLTGATIPDEATQCATPASTSFTQPTYDVSVNYQANRNLLVYLAHRRGYRAGGFNTTPTSTAAIPSFIFKPEKVSDVELGLKSDFWLGEMAGRFNLAVYHSNYTDVQRTTNFLTPTGTVSSQILNAAKAHINGGEAELTLKPINALTLSLNAAVTDAKYDDWKDVYLAGGVPATVDVSDSKFAFVPKTQFNGSISYDLPIGQTLGVLTLRASYYYQSSIQTAEINTSNCGPNGLYPNCITSKGGLPGYGLGNLRIDWRDVAGKGFDVSTFVDNVTNKFYRADAVNALGVFGFAAQTIAPPRMWGVEVRVPFGGKD